MRKDPIIMGILNITPNSFSDGGKYFSEKRAVQHALQMIEDGADVIDVGGESTRPGSKSVSEKEELRRVISVIKKLSKKGIVVSIDTQKPHVAEEAVKAGAQWINDVGGFRLAEMRRVAAKFKTKCVIMHMKGKPRTMQKNPEYKNVVREVYTFLKKQVQLCVKDGIKKKNIFVDPGIGFGKTLEHNLDLIKNLKKFTRLAPVLLGVSRKSLFKQLLGIENPKERVTASVVMGMIGVYKGVGVLRVHDVLETKRMVDLLIRI
ncbi:dihydropteroate synthase [Candidatus Margulisiibacteriota bacterium]